MAIGQTGQELMREGEPTDHFHIVSGGWACRYKTTRDGARQIMALLVHGDIANLDSFLFDRLTYGVRLVSAAEVLTNPRDRLLALADQHAGMIKTLTWLAFAENAILSQWALCLGRQSAKQRLAHLFCELSVWLDSADSHGRFDLPLTQEHIAGVLGLTSVRVNRTSQQLRAEGLIETGNCAVTIVKMDALCRIGDFKPSYLHDDGDPAYPRATRRDDRYQPVPHTGLSL
ncbi:Crp/Fnr family transcriptional regulator [Sphingomonas sp. CARO-RG-8B-R24-01]|uniref:Crp/Fnr family transcriptional regulator n=1 Tax=Sphingomonas sp. CARO-RG-8B-R24-01 TaxID=2914831 RepID=UPI001F57FDD6|nr:Crp/Fnr family transcriptional regulator [Sphingomonas sp. CARO-RG-8B-R24-01]